jgi:nucleotide-binding universal stress UspA family protein
VAEEICRTITCPVLCVGPQVTSRSADFSFKQILYPTDLSEESFSAAQYALSFALEYAAQLTVLHVAPGMMQTSTKPLARAFRDEVRGMIAVEVRSWCEPDCLVESGDPAETILRIAEERKTDLIVLGIRNPRALAIQRIGNVAYRVLAEAACPVLTVRR